MKEKITEVALENISEISKESTGAAKLTSTVDRETLLGVGTLQNSITVQTDKQII